MTEEVFDDSQVLGAAIELGSDAVAEELRIEAVGPELLHHDAHPVCPQRPALVSGQSSPQRRAGRLINKRVKLSGHPPVRYGRVSACKCWSKRRLRLGSPTPPPPLFFYLSLPLRIVGSVGRWLKYRVQVHKVHFVVYGVTLSR